MKAPVLETSVSQLSGYSRYDCERCGIPVYLWQVSPNLDIGGLIILRRTLGIGIQCWVYQLMRPVKPITAALKNQVDHNQPQDKINTVFESDFPVFPSSKDVESTRG